MNTSGFAAVNREGGIDVRTVSPTKIGAMVNWIFLDGIVVLDRWTDQMVENTFHQMSNQGDDKRAYIAEVNIAEVNIELAQGDDDADSHA